MRVLPMTNYEEVHAVGVRILEQNLERPETKELIDQLIVDPEADRKTLVHTAFVLGAIAALSQMTKGRFVSLEPHSDS